MRPREIASAAAGGAADNAASAFAAGVVVAAALLASLAVDVARVLRVKRAAATVARLDVRGARLAISPAVATPTTIGYLHPAVVVPEGFRDRLGSDEWSAVMAHERAHLVRRDDWVKALQSIAVRACWWLPGLWILARALDLEREVASDERAAAVSGARAYATCLLRLATCGRDSLAPAFARRTHVAMRIERLVRPAGAFHPVARAAALGAATACAIGAVSIAVLAVPASGPAPAPRRVARVVHAPAARPETQPRTAIRVAPVHKNPRLASAALPVPVAPPLPARATPAQALPAPAALPAVREPAARHAASKPPRHTALLPAVQPPPVRIAASARPPARFSAPLPSDETFTAPFAAGPAVPVPDAGGGGVGTAFLTVRLSAPVGP